MDPPYLLEERSNLAALLNRSEALEWVLDVLEQAVVVAERDGAICVATPEARRLLGAALPEAGAREWPQASGLFLPDAVTPFPPDRLPLARALRGETVGQELAYMRKDGAPDGVWISLAARPLRGPTGAVLGGVMLLRDCTEHRRVIDQVTAALDRRGESALAAADDCASCLPLLQRLLRRYDWVYSAVEQTADSVVITDSRGVIQYVNPGFAQTTGFGAEEALGHTPRILKSGKHGPEFYRDLWATILAGHSYDGLIVNRKKSGELYSAQQTISPIRDAAGHITHFVSVLKDVTDLIKAEEREFQLRLAREVQERFYGAAADVPGFDIAGATAQAAEVGGDYFDFLPLADGRLGVVVADVTGHGVGAALVMAETRAYLRSLASQTGDLGEILTRMSRALAEDLPDHQFVTLSLVSLDRSGRSLVYANAGHVPGFLMNKAGEVRASLPSLGPPLGVFQDCRFTCSEPLALEAGDVLVLMTDGVSETLDVNGQEFGVDGTVRYVADHLDEPARQILEGLQRVVRSFEHNEQVRDDVSAVVVKVGSREAPREDKAAARGTP